MRLKKNSEEMPSVIVIPMIDIMFFLLVNIEKICGK